MDRRIPLLLGAALLIALLLLLPPSENTRYPVQIVGNKDYLAALYASPTVVVRAVYPFSDPQGAVSAISYLSIVLSAKGKHVIVQAIEGNRCFTNEGNVERMVELNEGACHLPYPTIEIREGSGRIEIGRDLVLIAGPPQLLMSMSSYLLKLIYPDADEVYERALTILRR